jgi:hypothetical protein
MLEGVQLTEFVQSSSHDAHCQTLSEADQGVVGARGQLPDVFNALTVAYTSGALCLHDDSAHLLEVFATRLKAR